MGPGVDDGPRYAADDARSWRCGSVTTRRFTKDRAPTPHDKARARQ